ncbi:hypothetical protein AB0469_39180 [Streptomyces sp. NPDC093801]|uniref:hypothetical protein n=1 Tax=Streptomyces sp. NPDC093801 TaxID=3155203 RepID=UPI00345017C1
MDADTALAATPHKAISPYEATNPLAAALDTPNEPGEPLVVSYSVERLIVFGLLTDFRGHRRYSCLNPDQVGQVAAREGLAELLEREGPLGPEQAAARIGVRRVDFEWMRRLTWITPVSRGRVQIGASKAGAVDVPLFSAAHIDDPPGAHPEADWAQPCTVGKGRRSPARRTPGTAGLSGAAPALMDGISSLGYRLGQTPHAVQPSGRGRQPAQRFR